MPRWPPSADPRSRPPPARPPSAPGRCAAGGATTPGGGAGLTGHRRHPRSPAVHRPRLWQAPGVAEPLSEALVAEACAKSALVWLRAPGDQRAHAAWHVWAEGAVCLVTGGAEQPLTDAPDLADGSEVDVLVRSKDNGARLVAFRDGRVGASRRAPRSGTPSSRSCTRSGSTRPTARSSRPAGPASPGCCGWCPPVRCSSSRATCRAGRTPPSRRVSGDHPRPAAVRHRPPGPPPLSRRRGG